MSEQLLRDPALEITPDLLKSETGRYYPALRDFLNEMGTDSHPFQTEWRFYKDGKAWLCKISYKKKTVAWLSLWPRHFKVGLYFMEKSGGGIPALEIDEGLKQAYRSGKPIGKLKPLIAEITKKSQLRDVYLLMRYKAGI